jgi:3-polyprenyl-4-hydroxybenzoate decarboxylase
MATRFQGDRDLVILPRAPGSSLDPSSEAVTHNTCRVGFDLTKPMEASGKKYEKTNFPTVEIEKYFTE